MASRMQKKFDRKYSSYKKYTATDDVNYSTHSSRSSYRSETLTAKSDGRGRSSSTEIVSGSETRSYPVYIAIQDYVPDKLEVESIALEQGQIVEVLDKKNSARWLVRTKARPPQSGWVPGSYFETPTEYYKQRRRTREIDANGKANMTEEQEATLKRDQVYHDLLNSEEEFVTNLRSCVDFYISALDSADLPAEILTHREQLALNVAELYNFHANVLLKGLNYYSDDPGKVGQTFVRLERDFEQHVHFFRELPQTLKLLEEPKIKEYFTARANTCEAGASSFAERLQHVADRMTQYQNFFKEFVKYASRAQHSTRSVQKALELVQSIPQRINELEFTKNIKDYPGDTSRLGRLIRHDQFKVDGGDGEGPKDRYVFMFKNKLMVTEKTGNEPASYRHCATIRLDKYSIRTHTGDDNTLVLKPTDPGLPAFTMTPSNSEESEFIRKGWLRDIAEEHEAYGPEEGGTPRKKIKSPPVISPTGSTTSIYSGGSSSIDWTTTGTTLEMQGTRVTRTQYGFRTLQESSAKMCLKVTGYPLPEISWYKDDVQLHEDERHTFYADDDGFFAMTIDPVQVEDTGRYTCMATNEYGQASTSAFFRVLKVEKEAAPPKFVNSLRDQDCKEGEICSFECEVEGWPEPELLWLVDDQPLRPSHDFKLRYDGQKATLEIRDAQPDDTGIYTVKIQNEFGTAESKAELVVEPDPDRNHVAPDFQAVIEDVECKEGDEVRFKSVYTGDPPPEIVWMINGYPLTESEKVRFINEDGICILTIKDVTRHFDGIVTCQASNRLGQEQCTARLKVLVPPAPPTFNKLLEDKTVVEKNTAVFEVDVAGWPEPTLVFTLKGKELKHGVDGVEISGADGYFRVVINNCQQEVHEGEIVARASNQHGSAESRARLIVEQPEEESRSAPTFLKDIEDQTVKHGEPAVFETTVSGSPNPEVSWFINGHKMDPTSPGVKIEVINHDHKLTIDSAQYAGTVLCRAENVVGRFETKARLTVIPQEKQKKPPRFVETLKDVTETEQATVVFEVRVEGEPAPTVKWFLNGKELTTSDSRVEIREFDGSIKLELRNISLSDAGEIKAVATNSEGTAETSSKLTVKRKPFPPSFDKGPQSQTVEKGEWAEFTAHADGEPAPEYQWSVDGRKIRDTTEGATMRVENGTAILRLDTSIFSQSQSTISVTAENSLGMDETGCRLTVSDEAERRRKEEEDRKRKEEEEAKRKAEEDKKRAEEEEAKRKAEEEAKRKADEEAARKKAEEEEAARKKAAEEEAARKKAEEEAAAKDKAAPKVTRELQSQTVSRGDLAHFEAVIENATTVKWYHQSKEITQGTNGVKISQDERFEFRLSLDSSIFNEGEVSIVGENTLGTASSRAMMKITEQMKEFHKPEFTDKLKDMDIYKDEPFQMDVIALNSPQFKWYLNGKELKSGENGVEIINEGNKSSLKVSKGLPEHQGAEVKVTATNEVGTSECSSKLTLKERGTAPKIDDGPQDVRVKEGETAEFKIRVSGEPEPTVQWYLNEKIVEQNNRMVVTKTGRDYILRITEIQVKETGTIRVIASNPAGTDQKESKLTVEEKQGAPVFTGKLTETTVKENEEATWNVKLENPKDTTVKWYMNGKELSPKDGVQISDDGNGNFKLTVKASPDMDGTLTVKATNPAGTAEDSAKVNVIGAQRKPEFTKQPQNHETTIDESVKFSAIVEGIPTPQVSWYLNGKKLEDGSDVHVKHEPETGKTSIRIHKPKESDSGQVKVVAENALGKAETTAELKVSRKTEVPKFTTNMDDRQVDEGTTVKYTSTVEGYPIPTVEWTLNGEPVTKHPNIKISDDGINHTIEISDITTAQAGELSCQATNPVGFKKQNVQLAVKIIGEAPVFERNLTDLLVTEGEVTKMEAKLKIVKPKPKITWLKDGKEFTSDDHWKLEEQDDGTLILKIVQTEMVDKCRITIKAENHFGAAECAASLGVVKKVPMAKPAFQSDIAPINLVEGDSLQTKLLITGNPTPFVKWYINGQLVCETEDTEIKNANGVYSLTIHGCSADMTGKIKCTAYNKAGEVSTEGTLKVTKPIPVEFETSLCDATCREGDTLKLKAVLLGEPTPVVSWYVNGKKLEETQNIKIHAEKGTYTVTIKDITCDYSGKVVCEAVNEYGKASSEAMLLVLPRGEPPDFLEWLSNVRARQGSRVVHKVVFTGDPRPTLTWYINNQEIKADKDISIVTDDKTSTLTINNFNPEIHVGEIICKAENDAGEVSCTANMATYTSDMFSESESDAQLEEYGVEDGEKTDEESLRETPVRTPTPVMAPKFITKIKDTKAKKGGEAIFECVVPDTKGVVCKWLKDGKEIELIARIRVQSRMVEGANQIAHELIIEDVQPEDVGRYSVVVENSAGKDQCEASLTIIETLEKKNEKAPEFVTKLQDKRVETSEKVVFECKVAGEPKPSVSWYHETVKITESSTVKIETIDEVQRLTISSAELKDKGKYSCVAENTVGSTRTEATLEVTAQAPEFTKKLEERSVALGEKLILSCSVRGLPQPHVDFYRGETRLVSSERIAVEHDKTNTHWRIVIQQTTREELNIVYRAVASNSAGSATSEAKISEKMTAPAFEQGLKSTSVKEKEEIRMEVKVTGTGPEVQFLKDGTPIVEDSNHKLEKDTETGRFTLIIKESALGDAGKYTAKASNPAGSVESTAQAEVTQSLEAPTFVKELVSIEIKEKTSTTLSVKVKGLPEPEISWQKDGTPIQVDGSHLITQKISKEEYSLEIKEARKEDAGKYTCQATNQVGKAETQCEVKIAKESEAPRFTEELRSMEVKEKETLTLKVTVIGHPEPKIEWKKDGRPVEIDNTHLIAKDEGSGHFSLSIKDSRKEDCGTYSCVATNEAGVATTSCDLKMAKILEGPRFTEELRNMEVRHSESLTLSVTVTGQPEPQIQWKKDETPVNIDNSQLIAKDEGNGHFTLTIKEARQEDVGHYTAVAKNEVGTATTDCDVKFAKALEAPKFTEELRNREVKARESLTLSVTVTGEPMPEIVWKKDQTPVNIDNSQIIAKDEGNGHFLLTIKEARQEDVGHYTAVAKNPVGTAETQCDVKLAKINEAPKFTEELRNLEVKEKENLTLSVTVTGEPAPKAQWQKDSHPVNIDNNHLIAKDEGSGHFTLTIKDARSEDAGKYTAVAINTAGIATTECDIKFARVLEAPRFTEELRNMEVKEKETVNLQVTVTGQPEPKIEWKKDGSPVQIDNSHVIAKEDGSGHFSLTIKDARQTDVGQYSCVAVNEAGTAKTEAKMAVIEDLQAPRFTEGLKPLETEEGKPAELSVTVEGKPEPEVVFLKDGVEIKSDAAHGIRKDSLGHHVLVIKSVEIKDEGKYSCIAINKAGKDESIGELKIPRYSFEKTKEEEISPMFVEPLTEATASVGDTVTLECRVNSESKPEIRWFRDEKPIEMGPHIESKMTEDGLIKLTIHGATAEDLGAKYRCEAANKVGSAKTTADLKYAQQVSVPEVKEESAEEWAEMKMEEAQEKAKSTDVSGRGPPEFIELLRSCTVTIGETAVLRCRVKGEPRPTIKWTKDGKEVEMVARIKTEFKQDGYITLTIEKTEQTDAGEYKCHAENEHGKAWTEGPIVLTQVGAAPIDGEAPDFVQPVRPVIVEEGEIAILEGKISGKPKPTVKWYKNGKEIQPDDRIKIEDLPDGTQRLTVKDALVSDTDEYRCSASNEFGDVWADVTLTVKEKHMEAPEFVKELRAVAVVEGKKAEFECRVSGIPKPDVKWFKDGEELKDDTNIHRESSEDGTEKLIIEKSKVEDQGNYKIELTNPAGQMSSKAPLTVTPAETLKIKKGLEDQKIIRGTKILLSVEVEGKPKTVKWYRDNQQLSSSSTTKLEQVTEQVYRLEIASGQETDAGSYRVVLSTESVSVESSCQVTVTEGVPTFKKGLTDQKVPKGTPMTLEVEIEGKPKSVKWYKGDEELKGEDLGNGKYRLVVPNFDDKDVGKYKVVAENADGKADSQAQAALADDGKDRAKPEIVSGLIPTSVNQGETATFTVKVKGPVKGVKWYKNGKEIPNAKTKNPSEGVYVLEVPNCQKDDAADYKVVLSNDAGDADSSAALTVKLPRLEIAKGLEDQAIPKGEKAVLEVKTKGKPKTVKWYKNGKEISPSDKAKPESAGDDTYRLVIPKMDDDDVADYKVVLADDDGNQADSSCALTVKLPKLEIVKGLEDQAVEKGKKATLELKTNAKPKTVKWYKNGKEISPSDKAKPESDGTTHKLVIPDAEDDDAAEYKVVLTGEDDSPADSHCALTVKLPAEEPRFIKGLEDQTVPVGKPLELEIKTSGSPKTVKWYKNGKEIAAVAGKINLKKIDDNNYVLEVPKSAVEDSGDYKVEIENEAGKATSQGKITVEPQLTFVKPLKDQEVVEGENAEFKIETNAKPRTVKWYKNGQEISPSAHFVISGEDKSYTLTIKQATKEDAAQYKVVLSNSAGDVDSSAKLTVKKAKPGAPKILKGLEDQVVAKGAALIFEVKVEGEVEEVRWMKHAAAVGPNAKLERIDEQTYRLTIPNADLDDAGQYSVELINAGGKAKSDAKGEVDEKPEIVKGLQDTEVQQGDDDVLKVEVSTPVRTVKWYKNGQEITPSKHLEPKKIGPKKYELAINKAQLDDGATYKVVLANAAGECDSSAALTVTKPNVLKILEGLKDIDVNEGQPLALKVKVEGIPKTVKWYKNGQEITPSDKLKLKESPETGEFSLEIPASEKSDGAAYRVILANEKGEVYSGCVAHVKAQKPSADSGANFLSPLQDTEVEEGETLTLTCKVGGEPFPDIKWEKDGVPLEKNDRVSMRTALDGTVTLRIRDSKKSDLGQYRVTASNPSGTATSACAVNVKDKGEEPTRPHFIIPLSSCSAAIGNKKEFQVKVRGFPKPDLKWTLNGKPLTPSDRIQIEDIGAGNYCLTIKDVREEDYGTLRCVATNNLGSDETSCEFDQDKDRTPRDISDDRYPPRFNVPLWDRRIPVHDLMTIECHVDAKPQAEISWFFNGEPLKTSDRLEIRNSSDGACRVRIDRFAEQDCGTYKCVAKNELGVADTQSILSVEIPEEVEYVEKKVFPPKFNPGLEDRTVNQGQALTLSCRVTSNPRAAVTWYKDGLPLRADGRISLEYSDDGNCTLSIAETREKDEGSYRCVATNEHGSINTSCLVTVKTQKTEVKKEGEEPFFTKNLVDIWTDRGETFTLKCAVKGDPFPEIKWYRNGQLVRNGPKNIIETSPTGECSLTVKECTMSDEGIYRCEAENKHGKAKTQATAHVQMALGKSDKPKLEEGSPPRFIIPLSDQTVTLGGIIDLECKVTGQPMPSVKWSKDGGPIWEDLRYDWDIDEAKGTYHLRIKTSIIADEGTYRCVATNESGSATTKAFIRIDDGAGAAPAGGKTSPPRFSIKLGDARATEGQPLKLECKVEGFPLPELTWHKDGAQIQPSDRIQLSMGPDGTARLLIPSCNMDDDGIYRVIATNPSGTAHDKGNAVIKRLLRDASPRKSAERDLYDSNKAVKLLEPLENVKVPEKEGFKLRCKWSGEPKPTIKWFKDGERVFPYGRLQLVEHDDGVCELIVAQSTRHDAGGYRCVAENSYGSGRTTCDVIVIPKEKKPRDIGAALAQGKAPGFTVPLTIKRAKPGQSVTFECLPYGTPFPTIKWLKDGIELVPDEKYAMESLPDGTQKLTVKDVNFISEGYFRCVATNEHGTASTKAELVVEGDRSLGRIPVDLTPSEPEECKPRIRRGLYNMSIHQGSVVEMIVCATGWPTPTVKWYKDGEEIISDGPEGKRVFFTDERGIHHLVILNSGPEDEGEYSLEATNKLGSARTEGALNIIRPRTAGGDGEYDRGGMPFPPGFVRQLKNKHVFNHMPTIFDCLVVGYPAPEVEWFHNGKKIIPDGKRVKIQSCGGGSHAIIILDTTLDDAGEYVAIAKNSHGTASSSAILDVTVPHLDNIKFNGEIDVTPYLTEEYGFKKINVASLPTPPDRGPFIKEVTGHYLTLSWIPTKRAPPRYPQVTYVIEIRELPEKDWTLLDYNIPEPVCKVRNLELGKSYQFRVRAENIYGISDPSPASPPSRLMAPPQPVLDKRTKKIIPLLDPYAERALDLAHAEQYACAPWFAPGVVEKRYCAENDTLTLILNVSGYPDPQIQWKFRGWDVDTTTPTSKYKVHTYGGTETTLTICGFSKENVGQYQCLATNSYGEAQQNIMVDLATRPSFIQPLTNKTFSSAHPMRLDVRVEGEPFPELKWMKEWRPIVESTRVKFVQDGPYLCSLIINDPMWRDSGIYSCVAINDAGQATTSCTVTVEADGDYNDVELPKKRVTMDARKVREIYEIEEADEKLAASGAPFRVKERKTGKQFLAQLKPFEEAKRGLQTHNALEQENTAQYKQVIHDGDLAVIVYEDVSGTILENLLHPGVAVAEPTGLDREKMVQIFMRQLLLALEQMHGLRIAHLDLRPETILMQDGKLKLADFGQSRRLLRGLITGKFRSNPEFVSPEVVRGYPLTLATDLWSVGSLAYVLLTGVSPFHGDNDKETMENVDRAAVSFDGPEWAPFSEDAKNFVSQLLKEIPAERMTCSEALDHCWLTDEQIKGAQLPADGLREFNYKFKWLERRVFVQQTPSEQLLEAILAPSTAVAKPQSKPSAEGAGALEIYDYLRIKPRSPAPVEDLPRRKHPESGPVVPEGFTDFPPEYLPPGALPPPPEYHPRDPRRRPDQSPDRFGTPTQQQGKPSGKEKIPLDQFGRLVRPEDLARIPHDSFGRPLDLDQQFPREDPKGLGPIQQIPPFRGEKGQQPGPQRPPPPEYSMSPAEKRKLVPQEKGETPSKTRKEPRRGEDEEDGQPRVSTKMIRGERRQIEEEIANRILSDISEEGSVAGSLASIEDLEPMLYEQRRRQHSPSATPHAESGSSTPTLSPVNTVKEGNFFPKDPAPQQSYPSYDKDGRPLQQLRGDDFSKYPKLDREAIEHLPKHDRDLLERAENDPNIPIGAPLFLEGISNTTLTLETAPLPSPIGLSPKSPRRSAPGTKSPVMLSPGREHTMETLIAMKRGKPQFLPPGERAPEIDDEDAHTDKRKQKVKPGTHDSGFKDLQDELEKKRKTDLDDLDKYRPSNFYKDDADFQRPGYDIDDSPWDSHYQIGPDTYLMASQGPSFNSRVRDYRRTLWGDGAPLVRQGILGWRNQDITVRERRRFTDIMREMNNGLQPKQTDGSLMRAPSASAVDRIKADIQNVAPSATRKNADGTYSPIFVTRLRDAYLGHASAVFEASVAGSPAPKVQWQFQGKPLELDERRRVEHVGSVSRLTIQNPTAYDLGEYTCSATNEFGTDKTTSRLVSGEAPSRPGRPDCELSSDSEIFITWEPPEGPTYLEGITYRLEYRPADPANLSAPWVVISEHIDDEAVVVKHLEPLGVYQFRVTARNGVGLGVPSLSSRMVQTHGRGVPKLQVDLLKDHYRLNIVTLPQKSATQLNEISEESESEIGDLQQTAEIVELVTADPSERFQIDALLCKGKFSVLRAAVDGKTEGSAQCVVKIRDSRDADTQNEFKMLKNSQHENVQRLVGAYDNSGFSYLFCERLYEDVFSRFSFSDYYTEEQVAMTVRQLTSAIHYLHFRGIAHLDINPYNVMFQTKRNWIVKLIDFHSAQELTGAVKPTDVNVLWAAPEMHVPEVPVSVQSDVWGMAVITFCLLGGFHPYYSEYDKPDEIKENVLNVKCDPNLIPVTASQEALSFVTWGLKKSPVRRMRTDEALSHKFLSTDPSMVRRREASKYSASRLRKTISLTLPQPARPISTELQNKYGEKNIQ